MQLSFYVGHTQDIIIRRQRKHVTRKKTFCKSSFWKDVLLRLYT